jgi:hypothetical protein
MRSIWALSLAAAAAFIGLGVLVDTTRSGNLALAEDAAKPAYIGAEACKKCHFKQYGSWKKTAMALAFEKLKPGEAAEKKTAGGLDPKADYTKDAKCLKCHTTGYGTESGYPAVVEGKAWTPAEEERAKLTVGGQCEACHGPGSLYSPYKKLHQDFKLADIVALGATQPPTEAQCKACHVKECPTMAKDYAFDFEKAKKSDKDIHDHVPLKFPH